MTVTVILVCLAVLAGLGFVLRARLTLFLLAWYNRHAPYFCTPVYIAAGIGLAASALVFLAAGHVQRDAAWHDIADEARRVTLLVENRVLRLTGAVDSIAALYAASNEVERDEFAEFTARVLTSNRGLTAMAFIPRVPGAERAGFEAGVAAEGFTDFAIRDRDASGELSPAAQRESHYPVLFVEPMARGRPFIGLDLGFDAARKDVFFRARDTGRIAASGSIRLLGGGANGVLWVAPIYSSSDVPSTVAGRRAALKGFGVGVARLENLLSVESPYPLRVTDESGETIFASEVNTDSGADISALDHRFDVGGHTWTISVRPGSKVLSNGYNHPLPWLLTLATAALAMMLVHYLGMQRVRERETERLVVERTMKFVRANEALEAEMSERQRMQAHLVQSQKMEAIGQLTGGIAHDFNNILMIVDGYARRAAKAVDVDGKAFKALQEVIKGAEKAATLTKQMLVFSRRQAMEKKTFRIGETLRETRALLDKSVGDCELQFDFENDSLCVHSDPAEFTQAILHLVTNARDAMPGGGTITIRTRTVDLDADLVLSHEGLEAGRFVEIAVIDAGGGIEETDKAHIFEPFFTTKEQGKGTGLGLAMVLGFAQHSGGTVDISSELGTGTAARILLPPAVDAAKEAAAEIGEDCRGHGETVLVVDDYPELLALNGETLKELGYNVLTAEDAFEALEVEEECEGGIDLLLSDVVMPQMGGFELCEIMREKRPDLKTIFISGYPNRAAAEGTSIPPNCQFLQKPVNPAVLAQVVRRELDAPALGG